MAGKKRKKRKKKKKKELGGRKSLAGGFIPTSQRKKGGRGMSRSFLFSRQIKKKKEKYGTWGKSREMEGRISIFKKEKGPLVPCSMTKQRAKIRREGGEKMEQGVFSSPSIRETEVLRRRRTKNRSASPLRSRESFCNINRLG